VLVSQIARSKGGLCALYTDVTASLLLCSGVALFVAVACRTTQNSMYSIVQCSTVQYSTIQYNKLPWCGVVWCESM
jgi:hypothetical protein